MWKVGSAAGAGAGAARVVRKVRVRVRRVVRSFIVRWLVLCYRSWEGTLLLSEFKVCSRGGMFVVQRGGSSRS